MNATNSNWVVPVWWDQFVIDWTVGIQFSIAKCQQILGKYSFVEHLPSAIASILSINAYLGLKETLRMILVYIFLR